MKTRLLQTTIMAVIAVGAFHVMPANAQFGGLSLPGLGGGGQQQSTGQVDPAKEIEAIIAELGVVKVIEQKGRRMIASAELALVDAVAVQGVASVATANVSALVRELKAGKGQVDASAGEIAKKVNAIGRMHDVQAKKILMARDTAIDTATKSEVGSMQIGDTIEGMDGIDLGTGKEEVTNIEQRKTEVDAAKKAFDTVYGPGVAAGSAQAKAQFVKAVVSPVATRMGAAQAALQGSLNMIPKINARLDAIDKEAASMGPAILEEGAMALSKNLPSLVARSNKVISSLNPTKDFELVNKLNSVLAATKQISSIIERNNANIKKVNSILKQFSGAMRGSEPLFRQSVGEAGQILEVIRTIGPKALAS